VSADAETELFPSEYVIAKAPDGKYRVYNPLFAGFVEVSPDPGGGRVLALRCPRGKTLLARLN
jgi:hypothetical protein